MNKSIFSFLVLIAVLVTACNQGSRNNSQPSSGPGGFNTEDMVNRQIEGLDEAVNLSNDQEKQVREIYMDSMDDMMKMREQMRDGGDREGMREQMQQAREEQNEKMKKILSEEQWEKYLAYEEERRSRRGQGRPGGRPE